MAAFGVEERDPFMTEGWKGMIPDGPGAACIREVLIAEHGEQELAWGRSGDWDNTIPSLCTMILKTNVKLRPMVFVGEEPF